MKIPKPRDLSLDFYGRAVAGVWWLQNILSFPHRGQEDRELSGCTTEGRSAGSRKGSRNSRWLRVLTALPINKVSGWQVFISELSWCNL